MNEEFCGAESKFKSRKKLHDINSNLDSFGTWSICWLVTLPLIMSLSCFFVPAMWKSNSSTVEIAVGSPDLPIIFELKEDVNSLGYIRASLSVDAYNISRYVCMLKTNTEDGSPQASSPYDGQLLVKGHLQRMYTSMNELVEYSVPFDEFRISDGVNCSSPPIWEERRDGHRLHVPLEMVGLDMPGVVGAAPRWITFNITTIGSHAVSSSSSFADVFYTVRLTLTSQNAVYALISAITILVLVLMSLLAIAYLVVTIVFNTKCSDESIAHDDVENSRKHLSGLENLSTTRLSGEQGISLLLLVFLATWQNPIRSICIIVHYLSIYSLNNTALLCTGICGALSSYGLLFALVIYVKGLKYNSMGNSNTTVGRRSRIERDIPSNFALTARPLRPPRSCPPVNSPYEPLSWATIAPPRSELERQSLDTTPLFLGESNQNSPLAAPPDAQWFSAPPPRKSSSVPVVEEDSVRIWNLLLLLLVTWLLVVVYWVLKFPALCAGRWLPFDAALVGTDTLGVNTRYIVMYMLVESVVIVLSLMWFYCVLQALYSTASRLKRSRYMGNRYHQIAYVLLLTQINLGLLVLLAVLVWQVFAMNVVSSGRYQFGDSPLLWLRFAVRLFEYYGGLRAIASAAPLKAPDMELIFFVSFLVYSIVYLANHQSTSGPVVALEGGEQRKFSLSAGHASFVNLERDLIVVEPDSAERARHLERRRFAHQQLKRSLIERKYVAFWKRYVALKCTVGERRQFCLETACMLLEASYQTYFPIRPTLPSVNPAPPLGPFLDLARLDLNFASSFSDPLMATSGYLGENMIENRAVVAFRGSTLANLATDFKFALIALPYLKQSRRFFIRIIREADAARADQRQQDEHIGESLDQPSSSDVDVDELLNSSWVSIHSSRSLSTDPQDNNSSHRAALLDAYAEHSVENEVGEPWPEGALVGGEGDRSVMDLIQAAGASIPLVKQGFPRVHAGFWAAYASVREQFLVAAVMAILKHRRSHLNDFEASYASKSAFDRQPVEVGGWAGGDIEMGKTMDPSRRQSYGSLDPDQVSSQDGGTLRSEGNAGNHELQMEFSEMEPLRISITGHSLGGAMAVLAALDLSTNMRTIAEALCCEDYFHPPLTEGISRLSQLRAWTGPVLSVYVYGSPRLGNAALMSLVNRTVPSLYRVQVNGDLVTMVPKIAGFYRHVGTAVVVDDEEGGGLVLNPSILEQVFLRRTTGSLANHSLDRYRVCMEACFERDELDEYRTKEFRAVSRAQHLQQQNAATETGMLLSSSSSFIPDWLVGDHV